MSNIFEHCNFVTDEECDFLLKCAKESTPVNTNNQYFDDMVIYPQGMQSLEGVELMDDITTRMLETTCKNFEITQPMYRDAMILGVWVEGKYMAPHQDNQNLPGQEEYSTPWREYTAILYLNDDYEGGELLLPDKELRIKPKKAQLCAIEAGERHGVAAIKKGVRYTLITWFTSKEEKSHALNQSIEYCRMMLN